jgi:cell division protein FtsB
MDGQGPWRWLRTLVYEKHHQFIIWAGVGCFLLLMLLALAGDRGFLEVREFYRHLARVETQIRTLEEENRSLRSQVADLKTDRYQIEKLAREDLGLAYPDELIFEIVDPPDAGK